MRRWFFVCVRSLDGSELVYPFMKQSRGPRYVDDEPQAERGKGGLHLLHSRGVTQVEYASDLREMPAQPARKLGTADTLLPHRVV